MVLTVILVLCVFFLIRNRAVYRFRVRLLAQVRDAAQHDIEHGDFTTWRFRYLALQEVSYDTMLLHFWKGLTPEEWYPDTSFLRP